MAERKPCAIDGCPDVAAGRGWCNMHYQRWYRSGDPTVQKFIRGDDQARFLSHVAVQPDGCHLWTGAVDEDGYGKFRGGVSVGQRMTPAHVWAWEQVNGPVPAGMVLDHFRCDFTSCVNAEHVRPVTQRENILRGTGLASINLSKQECPQGHPYDAENTLTDGGRRTCKACRRRKAREHARRQHRCHA